MTSLEKLLILNAQQSLDLAKAGVTLAELSRTLADTTAALVKATEMIKAQQSRIELLTLDLAEARAWARS